MTIKMQAPEGLASISIDGETFPVKDGLLIIPRKFINIALENGFHFFPETEFKAFECEFIEIKENIVSEKKSKSNSKKVD
jgi:hypothetical protein